MRPPRTSRTSGAATIGLDTGTFPPSAPHLDHRHRPHLLRIQRYPQPHLRQSYLRHLRQSYLRRPPQRPPYRLRPQHRRLLLGPTLRLSQEQRTLPMR
jgi:hypothetical protein